MSTRTTEIQFPRKNKANLPSKAPLAVPIVTTNTHELYIGTGASLVPLKVDQSNILNPSSGSFGDVDGGNATSIYGGTSPVDGGGA